jgi:hypothetical protein
MIYEYNIEHEARKKLEKIINLDVQLSGLVILIPISFPCLAASPDYFFNFFIKYVVKPFSIYYLYKLKNVYYNIFIYLFIVNSLVRDRRL